MEKIIFHIDVNSAYLSWSALDLLNKGSDVDLREIPSIIGGDMEKRHGVVLAKSIHCNRRTRCNCHEKMSYPYTRISQSPLISRT